MAGEAAIRALARFHARHGTTSLLATTVTAPADDLRRVLAAIGAVADRRLPGEARVLGVHLEGPFISPTRSAPSRRSRFRRISPWSTSSARLAPVKVATIAPEIDPDHALLQRLRATACGCSSATAAPATRRRRRRSTPVRRASPTSSTP